MDSRPSKTPVPSAPTMSTAVLGPGPGNAGRAGDASPGAPHSELAPPAFNPIVPRNLPLDAPQVAWLNQRPYYIHQCLGRGGFAEVYRAELLIPEATRCVWDADGEPQVNVVGTQTRGEDLRLMFRT